MTRLIAKKEEVLAGDVLLNFLRSQGVKAEKIFRAVEDRPDLFFRFNSRFTVGCECVQIPPGRIYKYIHSRFKQLEKSGPCAVQIVWPQEQHYWVSSAIKSKNNKIEAYKKRTNADQIWLLIHSPVSEKDTTIRYNKPEVMELIKFGANNSIHDFDAIYFWDPLHGITQIYPLKEGYTNINFDLKDGYPTDGFLMTVAQFKTRDIGEDPVEIDLGVVSPEIILVPPQCPEFKNSRPVYTNKKHRIKMIVGATTAQVTIEPVDKWRGSNWKLKVSS